MTPQRSRTRSSIGMKILMAVSGLYFIFFVLFHMYGNTKMFLGQKAFDEYAHHLRTMFEPILPYTGFLWLFRLSLILAIVLHLWSAFTLWSRANSARDVKYTAKSTVQRSLSSQWMRWGGVTLLLFIVWHLLQFTIVKFNINGAVSLDSMKIDGELSPYKLAVAAFQVPWLTLIYLIALLALALHIHHGTWSAMQTLGWTNTARARVTAKTAGLLLAAVTCIGFALPPIFILLGVIK